MMGHRYGGFWRRWLAYFIDKLIICFLFFFIIVVELVFVPSSPYAHRPDVPAGIWGELNGRLLAGHLFVFVMMGMAYSIYFHGTGGQTPGKVLLKLKVIRVTGENLTYGVAWLRWLGTLISRVPFYLGFFWIIFASRKQGWHDKLAGTLVVIRANKGYQA